MHFGRSLKRDVQRIGLSMDPEAATSGLEAGAAPAQEGQDWRADCPFPECIFRGKCQIKHLKLREEHHLKFKCPPVIVQQTPTAFGNIARRSRAREAKRLATTAAPLPALKYWCDLVEDKKKWEQFVEENLTVSRLAHIIQKRNHGIIAREYAITLAK